MLPELDPKEDIDDLFMKIHGVYQSVEFNKENIEQMCEEATKLMQTIHPKDLILNENSSHAKILDERENPNLEYYIKAYSQLIFDKCSTLQTTRSKTFADSFKNIIKELTDYGTKTVTKAYSHIA